jgi:hypothetical protein
MQKHSKIRNVPFPRPCGATGNDAQKLHAYVFAHCRGAALMHEVLCRKSGWGAGQCIPPVNQTDKLEFVL